MNSKKMLKYLIIAVVALIIFAIVGKRAGWLGKGNLVKVSTEKAVQRTIVEVITASGKVQPEMEVKISPDVSGEIVELFVKEGNEVKQGDMLLKINPDLYMSNLDRVTAALNSAKSNYANTQARLSQIRAQFRQAELTYNRQKKLWEQKTISQAEYENALSAYEIAKAEVDASVQTMNAAEFSVRSAEASLKEAKDNLTKTTVYAPISGTISKLNVEKGERVVGTVQFAGTEMLRIANLSVMEVVVDVNENDIVKVHNGDTSLVEIDAYMNHKFKGIVTEIANSANTSGALTDQVTNFNVKVRLLPESYKDLIPKDKPNFYPFRPGLSATVDIQTHTKYNVLSVPIQSVTTRTDSTKISNYQNTKKKTKIEKDERGFESITKEDVKKADLNEVVFVFRDGKVLQTEVKTGIQDNNFIEIITGLTINDEVVSAPYSAISKYLKDNIEVLKVDKTKLFEGKEK